MVRRLPLVARRRSPAPAPARRARISIPFRAKYSRSTSAARVSFPGGLTVSSRSSACSSAVTSSRRALVRIILTPAVRQRSAFDSAVSSLRTSQSSG